VKTNTATAIPKRVSPARHRVDAVMGLSGDAPGMSLLAALTAGGVVGVRHALEADHLAAVATLVDEDRSALVGASWGVGHTVPILALGLLFVAFGVEVPERFSAGFEAVVGVVLVAYGARMLADAGGLLSVETHSHGANGDHLPGTGRVHSHLRVGRLSLGPGHVHVDGDSAVVGVLHGLAGSGGLVVIMPTAAPSADAALGFLLSFGLLTTVTMALIATVWGRTLGTGFTRVLKTLGGLVGIVVGAVLVAEVALGLALLP
jgi:hypothetical protein